MVNVQMQTMINFGVQKMLFTKETGKIVLVNIVLDIFVLDFIPRSCMLVNNS